MGIRAEKDDSVQIFATAGPRRAKASGRLISPRSVKIKPPAPYRRNRTWKTKALPEFGLDGIRTDVISLLFVYAPTTSALGHYLLQAQDEALYDPARMTEHACNPRAITHGL